MCSHEFGEIFEASFCKKSENPLCFPGSLDLSMYRYSGQKDGFARECNKCGIVQFTTKTKPTHLIADFGD